MLETVKGLGPAQGNVSTSQSPCQDLEFSLCPTFALGGPLDTTKLLMSWFWCCPAGPRPEASWGPGGCKAVWLQSQVLQHPGCHVDVGAPIAAPGTRGDWRLAPVPASQRLCGFLQHQV